MLKNNQLIIFLIIILILLNNKYSFAQEEDCSVTLKQAEDLYDEGNIEDVPDLLDQCIRQGFNKNEKLRAYKLIITSYLFDDQEEKADELMLKLLSLEPEYELNEANEPVEFVNLFKSYRTMPVYSIGFYGGVNVTNNSILETYSVGDLNTINKNFGKIKTGFLFGIIVNRALANRLELCLEPAFMQNKFEYIEEPFDFLKVTCNESHSRLYIPLTVQYQLGKKKVSPYIRVGGSGSFLISANMKMIRAYNYDLGESIAEIKGSDISITENRRKLDFNAIIGGGLKYKIPKGKIGLDIRYNIGFMNQTIGDNRYSNSELLYKYYYIDNDYLLNNIAISLSYVYLIYKPIKNK